jgi:dGTP triphosphohydrolase
LAVTAGQRYSWRQHPQRAGGLSGVADESVGGIAPVKSHIADYIAGMADRYALIEHAKYFKATPELR